MWDVRQFTINGVLKIYQKLILAQLKIQNLIFIAIINQMLLNLENQQYLLLVSILKHLEFLFRKFNLFVIQSLLLQ
jgi:hypothetical protein